MTSIDKDLFKHLDAKKILVVGDIMLDEYHWCKVSRISPEAPVPVCQVEKSTRVPGGAANVALNILTLGSTPILIGVVGKDSAADSLKKIFRKEKLSLEGLIPSPTKPTILKTRIVAHQQHIVRVDHEDASPIAGPTQKRLLEIIKAHINQTEAILLSDYQKGTLPKTLCQKIIKLAKEKNIKVIVDPKGDNYLKYKGATILTPNFKEFTTVIKKNPTTEKQIFDEGQKLIKKLQLEALLITRSEKGMSLIKDGSKIDLPTQAKEVYDITGAGDTVISMLSIGLAANIDFDKAAYLANFAAGIVVAQIGTSSTSLKEIEETYLKSIRV
jgi:rfaE bifunctional protein kinase chain/domain